MLNAVTVKPHIAWAIERGLVACITKDYAPGALNNYIIALHAGKRFAGPTAEARALAELAGLLAVRGHLACVRWTSKGSWPELWWMTREEHKAGRLTGSCLTCADMPTSTIFATATLRLLRARKEPISKDGAVWTFEDVKPVPGGVPCTGRQGVWNVNSALCERIVDARHPDLARPGFSTQGGEE